LQQLTHACILLCSVYYLKATFGLGTRDAVLEIPVSITGFGWCLEFEYQISSPRIELAVYVYNAGKKKFTFANSLNYTYQEYIGRWNDYKGVLDADVEAVQLVAKKTGCTSNVDYVLVDVVKIEPCLGNVPVII